MAERVGLTSAELASFNGRATSDVLRDGEVLALPRRVTAGDGGGTDIASIARGAIDEAEPGRTAAAPEVQPGTEPVRHRVGRGETAYSIARLYGVSVRALAEWNGLGPDLAVRENQYLLIPIVLEESASEGTQAPGTSIAPPPPSAAEPLPDPIATAPLPPASGGGPTPPAPEPEPEPQPEAEAEAEAEPSSRFARPVEGSRPAGVFLGK